LEPVVAALASGNEHKLRELRRVLDGWHLTLVDAAEFPPEEGETYYANAREKARFARGRAAPAAWVLGEDSGIEVEALGGRPGVASNRWAAPGEDHVEKLLAALRDVPDGERGARYVSELVGLSPETVEFRGTGVLAGRIAAEPRGSEGFGYDPIFVPDGEARTVAELGNDWKAENSHRARSARALLSQLQERGLRP
jgi:XTP/dITP diphosphohydrolase